MKQLKRIGLAALVTTALSALAGAPSASATTLEVRGIVQNRAVSIHLTMRAGTSSLTKDTFGFSQNTCLEGTAQGETERVFTTAGTGAIGGALKTVTVSRCSLEPMVVHRAGTLSVQWIRGTTNGTVFSSGLEQTVPVPGGTVTTCTTNNTPIGTLTGVARGNAIIDVTGVIACTGVGTVIWTGTFTVTSPEGLGVVE
jgi:hypothetical protein